MEVAFIVVVYNAQMNFEFSAFSEKIPMIKNYLCMLYVLFIVSPVNLQCIFGKLVRKGTVKINIPSTAPGAEPDTHIFDSQFYLGTFPKSCSCYSCNNHDIYINQKLSKHHSAPLEAVFTRVRQSNDFSPCFVPGQVLSN